MSLIHQLNIKAHIDIDVEVGFINVIIMCTII